MNPTLRWGLVLAALAGAWIIGSVAWKAVAANLNARRAWTRTDGEIRAMAGPVEFELGKDPDTYRALATVDHTWDLSLFKRIPLFVDPADPTHIKPATFLQMWLSPLALLSLVLLLLSVATVVARLGAGALIVANDPRWTFTAPPDPLTGIVLHSPSRQWKIVCGWSLLGVALAVFSYFGKDASQLSRIWMVTVGTAFTLSLWTYAWHTRSLEISADSKGIRMSSALGWRDVPWTLIKTVEDQSIYNTYYNGNMRMWELPFPGSTVRVFSLNDQRGRTLLSFNPELEPKDSIGKLFRLCTEQTGLIVTPKQIPIRW